MISNQSFNPYVGPRTFTRREGDRFFGREREARALLSLVISDRLTLFYAQSGAGKSSLINARLIPQLQAEQFVVLPVGRVSGEVPTGVGEVDNIFIFNLLLNLDQSHADPARFAHLSLADFARKLTTPDAEYFYYEPEAEATAPGEEALQGPPHVLIIDQFEEIITSHLTRWPERQDFFRQLAHLMANDPLLWVVLSLREDYVAALEPYAHLLPGKMQNRFYMQRMSYEAALEAVQKPAAQAGRPFTPAAAHLLVDNLGRIRVQGTTKYQPGQFVEPVQLQVACYQLWENLKEQPGPEITEQNLQELGDVDMALIKFYEDALRVAIQQTGLSERMLRDWFASQLITPARTSSLVYRGQTETEGLSNAVIDSLERAYIIRADIRGGETWYELAHDRLVEPIIEANRRWQDRYYNPVVAAYKAWLAADRDPQKLLHGQMLIEAQTFADHHPTEVTKEEKRFLDESARQAATEEKEEQARYATQRQRIIIIVTTIAALLLSLLAFWSYRNAVEAHLQAQISRSRELSVQARGYLTQANNDCLNNQANNGCPNNQFDNNWIAALLLGVEAGRAVSTFEVSDILLEALADDPDLITFVPGPMTEPIASPGLPAETSAPSPAYLSGQIDAQTSVIFFEPENNSGQTIISLLSANDQPLYPPLTHIIRVNSLALSPDRQMFAAGGSDGSIVLWSLAIPLPISTTLAGHTAAVSSLVFSRDSQILASGSADETIILWQVKRGQPFKTLVYTATVNSLAFSPDAQTLVSGHANGAIIRWAVDTGQPFGSSLTSHTAPVDSLGFSPDGETLASRSSSDGLVILWWPVGDQPEGQPLIPTTVVTGPNGQVSAEGDSDGAISLKMNNRRRRLSYGHAAPVNSIAFSPDGQLLASGSSDPSIILWDVNAHRRIGLPLRDHRAAISVVGFSPDGHTLVSKSDDGIIILRDINLEVWLKLACQKAGRNLNWEEWQEAFPPEAEFHKSCPQWPIHDSFIEEERQRATEEEDIEGALDQLRKLADKDGAVEPEAEIVRALIEDGQELESEGDMEGKEMQFQRARELAPHLVEQLLEAQSHIEQGKELAGKGDFEGAKAQFEEALSFYPSLPLEPEVEAKKLSAQGWLETGRRLTQQNQIDEAIAAYEQARQLDPELEVFHFDLNELCRRGALAGKAATVLVYCDEAVKLAPDDGWMYHDRGIARALVADFSGAIEDLNFFLAWAREADPALYEEFSPSRGKWIETLEAGQNPLDEATLAKLRAEF